MTATLIDADAILSCNEQWMKLEEEWVPVDLETEEDLSPKRQPSFSTLDMRKSTFDSSFLFKKVRRKVGRRLSKKSLVLEYKDFIQDLQGAQKEPPKKQFYFINGQIISAMSVEEICDKIDDVFKSVEKLCSATSTMRRPKFPDVVQCSFSTHGLSFDDTSSEKEKSDSDDVDKFIDEAFNQISVTIASLTENQAHISQSRETVTTLVRKFSSILNSPTVYCNPRRQKRCCERFKELSDFWNNRAFDCEV